MKMKLAKALLVAVLAACAYTGHEAQAYTPIRPYYVNAMVEDSDITQSIKDYQGKLSSEDDKANKAQAYVKDGSATATITGDINMDTRLLVREGKVMVSDATITQQSNGNYDFLVVAGEAIAGQTTTPWFPCKSAKSCVKFLNKSFYYLL